MQVQSRHCRGGKNQNLSVSQLSSLPWQMSNDDPRFFNTVTAVRFQPCERQKNVRKLMTRTLIGLPIIWHLRIPVAILQFYLQLFEEKI